MFHHFSINCFSYSLSAVLRFWHSMHVLSYGINSKYLSYGTIVFSIFWGYLIFSVISRALKEEMKISESEREGKDLRMRLYCQIILMETLFQLFLTHLQFWPRTSFWFRHACVLVFRKIPFLIHFIFTFLAGIIFRPLFTTFCYMFYFLSRKKSLFSY